jgi:hypothetical protein
VRSFIRTFIPLMRVLASQFNHFLLWFEYDISPTGSCAKKPRSPARGAILGGLDL